MPLRQLGAAMAQVVYQDTKTPLPLRTLMLARPAFASSPCPTVCLARYGLSFALIYAQENPEDEYQQPVHATLSVMAGEDPFPGFSMEGNECFWVCRGDILKNAILTPGLNYR